MSSRLQEEAHPLTYTRMAEHGHTQVRAYTFGPRMFAEVDVVLPADMPLREAHDIGESLQVSVRSTFAVLWVFIRTRAGEALAAFVPLPDASISPGVMPLPSESHAMPLGSVTGTLGVERAVPYVRSSPLNATASVVSVR